MCRTALLREQPSHKHATRQCKYNSKFAPDANLHEPRIQQQWANIHTVYSPDTICKSLGGAIHNASVCDIDFSRVESSGLLNFLDGIKTSGELCGALQGSYGGTFN